MNNLHIGIIVVSYRNPTMTVRYVRGELPKLTTPYTLVIVNNDSTPEECDALAEACGIERDVVVCSRENLGYAKGNNLGVATLKERGIVCSHYLFSNDDVEIKDGNILEVLCASMAEHEDCAAIGPRIIGLDGRDQNPHNTYISPYRQIGWKFLRFFRNKKARRIQLGTQAAVVGGKTYWVSGAFLFVDAHKFDAVEGFDSRTFLYMEEPILAERLKKCGWSMYYEPKVEVIHFEGGSTKKTNSKSNNYNKQSTNLYYIEYRNINCLSMHLYNMIVNK